MLLRKIIMAAAAVFAFTASQAQDNTQNTDQSDLLVKAPNVQKRTVGSFHAVHVSSAIDLVIKQGNEDGVAVSASDVAVRDRIITRVENGVLLIYFETKGFHWNLAWSDRKIKAFVSVKQLDELSASGSSDVYVDGTIRSDNLKIGLSGSSDFKGAVKVGQLELSQSGSSDVKISGGATNLRIGLSGASDVKGYDLVVDNCTIDASGSSDVYITVNKELRVDASGSSDVHYKGTAEVVKVRSSGSSEVSKKS